MEISDVEHKIRTLNEKTTSLNDIPSKILKKSCYIVSPYIVEIYKTSSQKKGFLYKMIHRTKWSFFFLIPSTVLYVKNKEHFLGITPSIKLRAARIDIF